MRPTNPRTGGVSTKGSRSPFDDLREVLGGLGQTRNDRPDSFMGCCPAHGDDTPSLHVTRSATDGRVLVHCHGGCATEDVVAAVGWTLRDLFPATASGNLPRITSPRPPPKRIPTAEVEATWARAYAVNTDDESRSWVVGRGLDADRVVAADLVRVFPVGATLPTWATGPGRATWTDSGHRAALLAFDASGAPVGMRARYIGSGSPEHKALSPAGIASSGLVYADAVAERMLSGLTKPAQIVVTEGEPDTLAAKCYHLDPDADAAVLGVFSGSWSADVAAKIPDGATVAVWTHDDGAGEKYAASVAATLAGRCSVVRGVFPVKRDGADKSDDLADLARAGRRIDLFRDVRAEGQDVPTEADAVRGVADFARTLASSPKPGALGILEKHVAGLRASFDAPTEPGGWGWADPAALLAEPEEPIRWYVHNLLAPGHVTSLNASPKCGKTTTVTRGIVGPLSRGEAPFCGTAPEEPIRSLWLTEESRRGARNHVKYGGIRGGAVLPRPGPPASVPWPSVVEGAADHARKIGARILVFDTFARHARLKGDEENSASAVGEAMEPVLRVAATHDLAVLLIHHVKKWASRSSHGGDVDLARGSGAFNANVDFYANLIKPEGRKPGQERYRELYGAGRDGVEDYKLTLDLLRGDGVTTFDRFRIVGMDEVARDDALDGDVLDLVRGSGENGITKAEIIDQVERRNSDVVASLTRLCKGSPPKIRRGKAAKGEKAPRFRLWEGGAS